MVLMMERWPCRLHPASRLFVLIIIVIFYLIFGAFVFSSLEERVENKQIAELKNLRNEFARKIESSCNTTESELEEFLAAVVKATQFGILVTNNVSFNSSWSFGQSLFFSATLITTIGYGHTLPLSDGGKVFAIVYCLFGLPLVLISFTAIVSWMMKPLSSSLKYLKDKLYGKLDENQIEVLHLATVATTIIVLFFIIPAAIFCSLESKWNYLDSLYYCFISLTTIGLGDYIPGEGFQQPMRAVYKAAVTAYLLVGLIFMMVLLGVLYNVNVLNITRYFTSDDNSLEENSELAHLTPSDKENHVSYTEESNVEETEEPVSQR